MQKIEQRTASGASSREQLFEYQRQMSAFINSSCASPPNDWLCSARIDEQKAGDIYRRNLHGGVLVNLASSFACTRKYIGSSGFNALATSFVRKRPASSPVFRTLAVRFPGFIATCDLPAPLRRCLTALATLDFISLGSTTAPVPMDRRFVELYRNVGNLTEKNEIEGLYRVPEFHPEAVLGATASEGLVSCKQQSTFTALTYSDSDT